MTTPTRPPPSTPSPYHSIRATYTPTTITVYQAYNPTIASAAVAAQKFVPPFKLTRMTWIKPSFLWMAYRSGWARKPGQERILAIELTRAGFEWALSHAVLSHPSPAVYADEAAWEERKRKAVVRVQWDPERDLGLRPMGWRSLQVGLGGVAVERFVEEWVVGIRDVTGLMREVEGLVVEKRWEEARGLLPKEEVYEVPEEVGRMIGVGDRGDESRVNDGGKGKGRGVIKGEEKGEVKGVGDEDGDGSASVQ
ncbi:hypothetical protein FQN50_005611 [Emmonsiellopsis sp. PD_5]|nr:hypothetical protein FQN50_005611 [Emmonsiellopsis sp. PD_5]